MLWRASVSSYVDFASFSLGSYEELAKKVILDPCFDFSAIFSVSLCYIPNLSGLIHLFSPQKIRIENVNCYVFIIGNCKVFIKVGEGKPSGILKTITLSAENNILMVESEFDALPERGILLDMVNKIRIPNKMV